MNGRIIILNGTSSAGKTTLARALRPQLPTSFCYYSSDQLADAKFRPIDPTARLAGREQFFVGFHRTIPALASAGLDLLVEHIVEEQHWAEDLANLLKGFDVFWVGVHASVDLITEREKQRGERTIGEALYHLRTHEFCRYGVEVDTAQPAPDVTAAIVQAWKTRQAQ
jgi:chloramphenicol 3-O phosphotransferase